jgi:hypothetical protein
MREKVKVYPSGLYREIREYRKLKMYKENSKFNQNQNFLSYSTFF